MSTNGNDPGHGQVPITPELQAALDALFTSRIQEDILPAIDLVEQRLTVQVMEQLAKVPNIEAIAQRTAQLLLEDSQRRQQQAESQEVDQLRARAEASGNGHRAPPGQTLAATSPSQEGSGGSPIKDIISAVVAGVGSIIDKGVPQYIALATLNMQKEQVKLARTDPTQLAMLVATQNPMMARFLGMQWAPDLMAQQIPGMIANATDAVSRAQVAGLLRSGWMPPTGLLPGPNNPMLPPPGGPAPPLVPSAPTGPQTPVNSLPAWGRPTGAPSGGPSAPATTPSSPSSAVMHGQRRRFRFSDLR